MASEIKVDTISEKTSAGGVTIDGLLIKDGGISGDVSLIGTTPTFTIGDAGAEDAALVFDGNAQDFYVGLDDSADYLVIGLGSSVGTTPAISINSDRDVTISDGAIDFDVASHDTSNGLKLGGTLVTATAAELNILDGVGSTATELNMLDGSAKSTSSITLADADAFIVIDGNTTKQIPASDISTYAGGGKIGQVVGSANAYGNNSGSQSYFDFQSSSGTTWEVAITPTASSSKIAVWYSGQLYFEHPNNVGGAYYLQYGITINRIISGGSYAAIMTSEKLGMYTYAGTAKHDSMPTIHMNYLDSPSTTSECKYKIMGKCIGQASTSLYHNYAPSATAASHIMLMEVLA